MVLQFVGPRRNSQHFMDWSVLGWSSGVRALGCSGVRADEQLSPKLKARETSEIFPSLLGDFSYKTSWGRSRGRAVHVKTMLQTQSIICQILYTVLHQGIACNKSSWHRMLMYGPSARRKLHASTDQHSKSNAPKSSRAYNPLYNPI